MDTIDNNISIKENMIVVLKESMKFAIMAVASFLVIGTSMMYILLKITNIDGEIIAILTGTVVAIFIAVVDFKRIHTTDKIAECNRRIFKKILKF